jgi:sugar-specific transcriptional regulator TrmB
LSLERIINTLEKLGLTRIDAEVYAYLAKMGPQKLVDLLRALHYNQKQITATLKILVAKELIINDEQIFSALSFDEALELLIQKDKEQTNILYERKKALATNLTKKNAKPN